VGFAPATAILGKAKEQPKERDEVSPRPLERRRERRKTSFTQVFLLPAPLLVNGLFDQEGILVGRLTTT
jgi:hypothetical protein